ncbi:hypothetical protein ABIC16_004248 [Sphingomonas sp. PvP055]
MVARSYHLARQFDAKAGGRRPITSCMAQGLFLQPDLVLQHQGLHRPHTRPAP